jgi:hypothetical protein
VICRCWLDRGLRTRTTVALSRAEARELAELLRSGGFRTDLALLQEALREAWRMRRPSSDARRERHAALARCSCAATRNLSSQFLGWWIYEFNSSCQWSAIAVAAARFGSITWTNHGSSDARPCPWQSRSRSASRRPRSRASFAIPPLSAFRRLNGLFLLRDCSGVRVAPAERDA